MSTLRGHTSQSCQEACSGGDSSQLRGRLLGLLRAVSHTCGTPSPAHPLAAPGEASTAALSQTLPAVWLRPQPGHRAPYIGSGTSSVPSGTEAVLPEGPRIGGHAQVTTQENPGDFRSAQKVWGTLWLFVRSHRKVLRTRCPQKYVIISPDRGDWLCKALASQRLGKT